MLADALLDLSNRGDIVIDPFLGSGSTLIAADKIGNVSRGVDLDSLYVEVIMRQYAAATGNPAVLIETGEAFDALAREGQGRQRRSRAGFQTRPRHYEALETTAPSTRASACTAEVRGSNPLSSTRKSGSVPDTWVSFYSGDMGNTFGPKGFSIGSSRHVSWSK